MENFIIFAGYTAFAVLIAIGYVRIVKPNNLWGWIGLIAVVIIIMVIFSPLIKLLLTPIINLIKVFQSGNAIKIIVVTSVMGLIIFGYAKSSLPKNRLTVSILIILLLVVLSLFGGYIDATSTAIDAGTQWIKHGADYANDSIVSKIPLPK